MSGSENSPVAEVTPGLGSLNYAEPIVDSDEDEIFFGPVKSEKEQRGRNSRYTFQHLFLRIPFSDCFIFKLNFRVDSRRETLKLNEPVIKVSSKEARRKSNLNGLILEEGDESEDKENLPGDPSQYFLSRRSSFVICRYFDFQRRKGCELFYESSRRKVFALPIPPQQVSSSDGEAWARPRDG